MQVLVAVITVFFQNYTGFMVNHNIFFVWFKYYLTVRKSTLCQKTLFLKI